MRLRLCLRSCLLGLAPVALLAAPSCSKILGIDDVSLRDAGTPPPDMVVAPPNTVIGKSFTRYQRPGGDVDVPDDLSQAAIQALIVAPAEPTGYKVVAGTGRADGTFTIEDVPDGEPYLLKLGTFYYATTAHVIERRIDLPIRGVPAPAPPTATTTVAFNVGGMTPFVNGPEGTFSRIEIHSLSLGYQGTISTLPNNAASFATPYDWGDGDSLTGGMPLLPEATHGDDLTLLHLREDILRTASGRKQRVTRLIDTFTPSGVTVADGATTNVNGSWVATQSNRPMSLSVMRGTFDAGYDGRSQFTGRFTISLMANPVRNDIAQQAMVFSASLSDWARSGALTETMSFMYADPFPADWSRAVNITYGQARSVRLPNTASALTLSTFNQQTFPYTGGNPMTAPVLQPPGNIRLAGRDASPGGLAAFDGTAPVELSWSPVAAAKLYLVRVHRVFQNGSQTRQAVAGSLMTAGTSIQIPAEVFSGGEFFMFEVFAIQAPGDYAAGQVSPNGIPTASAGTLTGMFRLSNKCGNGEMDPGEQCDTSGESMMCDVDCTPTQCGDGLRNAAAGEACDTLRDTPSCDSDCTLPVCGDGRINPALEDCDDGNAVDDGNGCSAACRFNNVCGDGTVQSAAEQCDPGVIGQDSATCDFDCTTRLCGDAHHNAAAGEQCDDGNSNNADGCTTTCQLN